MADSAESNGLSWPLAVVRAFLPVRLGLCLLGVAVTLLLFSLGLILFQGGPFEPQLWWQEPLERLPVLLDQLFGVTAGKGFFRSVVLVLALSVPWSWIAGWIAWSELRAQHPSDAIGLSAPAFLQQKGPSLAAPLPLILFFILVVALLSLTAAFVNWALIWGIGAVLAALALPLLTMVSLVILVAGVGCVSFCLMPSAIAAEGGDAFDAISRGFSYLYQRPFAYVFWWALSVVLALLPLAGVVALVKSDPNLFGGLARPLGVAGLVLSLSLFWSLQPLVYVKLRRLVDDVPEMELWSGRAEAPKTPEGPATAAPQPPISPEAEPAAPPVSPATPVPRRTPFRFTDALVLGNAADLHQLLALLVGLAWTALVLALGGWLLWGIGADTGPKPDASVIASAVGQAGGLPIPWRAGWAAEFILKADPPLAPLRRVVLKLAEQQPLILAGVVVGMVLLTAPGLARVVKRVGRKVALRAVYEKVVSLAATRPFIDQTGWQGLTGLLLISAGVVAFLPALLLVPLVVKGVAPWQEPVLLGSAALLLLALGALGVGPVAVEGPRLADKPTSPLGNYLDNGLETLASLVLGLVAGVVWSGLIAGFAWLTWMLTCDSLGWASPDSARWVRWGLDNRLVPETQGPLYWVASRLAGLWFFLLAGLVLAYPLSYILRWGVICYLRARQQGEEAPVKPLQLTDEERTELLAPKKDRKIGKFRK